MDKPEQKQLLKDYVVAEAKQLPGHLRTVAKLEKGIDEGVTDAFMSKDLTFVRVPSEVLRLDPELYQRMLILQDCQLALHRAWVEVSLHCSKVSDKFTK